MDGTSISIRVWRNTWILTLDKAQARVGIIWNVSSVETGTGTVVSYITCIDPQIIHPNPDDHHATDLPRYHCNHSLNEPEQSSNIVLYWYTYGLQNAQQTFCNRTGYTSQSNQFINCRPYVLCGDVEPNHGPTISNGIFPCGWYGLSLGWYQSGVACATADRCDCLYHNVSVWPSLYTMELLTNHGYVQSAQLLAVHLSGTID